MCSDDRKGKRCICNKTNAEIIVVLARGGKKSRLVCTRIYHNVRALLGGLETPRLFLIANGRVLVERVQILNCTYRSVFVMLREKACIAHDRQWLSYSTKCENRKLICVNL